MKTNMDSVDDIIEIDEDTQKDKFLTFSLGKEEYGIEIMYVTEIIGIQPITEIPEMQIFVKGIINLRGKIIPVIDVRIRFNKEYKDYNDRTCIIVIDIKDISVGLIVDSVSEVITIPEKDILPPPEVNNTFQNKYIKNIGKVGDEVKLLINSEKLISDNKYEEFKDISND